MPSPLYLLRISPKFDLQKTFFPVPKDCYVLLIVLNIFFIIMKGSVERLSIKASLDLDLGSTI